jgi:DNA-binding transcriptional MerR regulator
MFTLGGMNGLRVAELAARAGVAASKVRFYERAGLLSPARRAKNGYRIFDESVLEELAFIQRAKGIGMSLEDIAALVAVWPSGSCQSLHARMQGTPGRADQRRPRAAGRTGPVRAAAPDGPEPFVSTRSRPTTMRTEMRRFIEYMDVGTTNGWRLDEVVPAAQIISQIDRQWPLELGEAAYPGEVARRYRYRDGAGEIGVIASVTQPFCRGCTRARLSADGQLYTCLFAAAGHDLRGPLRAGASDQALHDQISSIWTRRADRYSEQRTRQTSRTQQLKPKVEMSHIGR